MKFSENAFPLIKLYPIFRQKSIEQSAFPLGGRGTADGFPRTSNASAWGSGVAVDEGYNEVRKGGALCHAHRRDISRKPRSEEHTSELQSQ